MAITCMHGWLQISLRYASIESYSVHALIIAIKIGYNRLLTMRGVASGRGAMRPDTIPQAPSAIHPERRKLNAWSYAYNFPSSDGPHCGIRAEYWKSIKQADELS